MTWKDVYCYGITLVAIVAVGIATMQDIALEHCSKWSMDIADLVKH